MLRLNDLNKENLKRINSYWYWILGIWIIFSITFIIADNYFTILSNDNTNLILGVISISISIVSVALATMRNPKYKGTVECWNLDKEKRNKNNDANGTDSGVYNCILFKVNNYNKEPIQNLVINFRLPISIILNYYNSDELKFRKTRETVIATFDNLRYLGNSTGDCDLIIKHYLNVDKWIGKESKRVIYVTVAGDNIEPTTFKIGGESIEEILLSNEDNKIKLD